MMRQKKKGVTPKAAAQLPEITTANPLLHHTAGADWLGLACLTEKPLVASAWVVWEALREGGSPASTKDVGSWAPPPTSKRSGSGKFLVLGAVKGPGTMQNCWEKIAKVLILHILLTFLSLENIKASKIVQ